MTDILRARRADHLWIDADCQPAVRGRRGKHQPINDYEWVMVSGSAEFVGNEFRISDIRAGGWDNGTTFMHKKTGIEIKFSSCQQCGGGFWSCWNCRRIAWDHSSLQQQPE